LIRGDRLLAAVLHEGLAAALGKELVGLAQKRCLEVPVMVIVELLEPLPPPPVGPPRPPEITWVAMPTVSDTSRDMFT
jgi:hypothetical protein